jgi:DNA-binding Lrp family transcriptional regulator
MSRHRTIAAIEAALRRLDGSISAAASDLGITAQAVRDRIRRSGHLQDVLADIDVSLLDDAESVLRKAIRAGDTATTRWFLERKGRARGYGTKVDVVTDDRMIKAIIDAIGPDVRRLRALKAALMA